MKFKKAIILIIYCLSIVVIAFALYVIFSKEERSVDLEYIILNEAIEPVLQKELYEKGIDGNKIKLAIIYFMKPFTCPVYA